VVVSAALVPSGIPSTNEIRTKYGSSKTFISLDQASSRAAISSFSKSKSSLHQRDPIKYESLISCISLDQASSCGGISSFGTFESLLHQRDPNKLRIIKTLYLTGSSVLIWWYQ
jgi:hypothetical protein